MEDILTNTAWKTKFSLPISVNLRFDSCTSLAGDFKGSHSRHSRT